MRVASGLGLYNSRHEGDSSLLAANLITFAAPGILRLALKPAVPIPIAIGGAAGSKRCATMVTTMYAVSRSSTARNTMTSPTRLGYWSRARWECSARGAATRHLTSTNGQSRPRTTIPRSRSSGTWW